MMAIVVTARRRLPAPPARFAGGPPFGVSRTAWFSRDGRYRYRLGRRWGDDHGSDGPTGGPDGGIVTWVMLNPSTADAVTDDPTIRRVIGLSRAWGYGGCEVVNLFALRTTTPAGLRGVVDPAGPGNRAAVGAALDAVAPGGVVVVAWGACRVAGVPVAAAAERLLAAVRHRALRPVALARNADGSPRHPLYVPRDAVYSDLEELA